MPYRKTIFANNEIYHTVNRGVNHAPIFVDKRDYNRFIGLIDFLRHEPNMRFSHFHKLQPDERTDYIKELEDKNNPLVEIIAYCLMPNHFHLLLKQLRKEGIQTFMKNLQISYAKYFNTKHNRVGPLCQSVFHSVRIETDEQLNHVSRYIHLNPVSSYLVKIEELENYKFSSVKDFLGKGAHGFIKPKVVLENFKSPIEYKEFLFDHAEYQRNLDTIKHLTLENR